jgi:hypothetical protein
MCLITGVHFCVGTLGVLMNRVSVRALMLCSVVTASALSACATTGVSTKTTALADAATQFNAVATAPSPIPAAEATLAQARMLQAAAGGSIQPLDVSCGAKLRTLQAKFDSDLSTGQPMATLDVDYSALMSAPACGVPVAPGAAAMKRVPLIVDLDAYFAGLESLGAAKDAKAFDTAADNLSAAISGFAAEAGASTREQAATGVFSKLVQTALQEAEYQAMKKYVADMDTLLARSAPAVTSALRAQQAFYMTVVTDDAAESAGILDKLYQDPAVTKQPSTALEVYAASAPIITELKSEQAAVRVDPAKTVKLLVAAHHALYLALETNKGQFPVIVSNVTEIATSAESLIKP